MAAKLPGMGWIKLDAINLSDCVDSGAAHLYHNGNCTSYNTV